MANTEDTASSAYEDDNTTNTAKNVAENNQQTTLMVNATDTATDVAIFDKKNRCACHRRGTTIDTDTASDGADDKEN